MAEALRLLYVDDDRINILLFEETCRLAPSLEVRCVESGQDALAAAREFRPDVFVIDLRLPDTDGYALLSDLRTLEGMAGRPAFLCSAESPDDVAGAAARAGFTGCWSKPVMIEDMLADLSGLQRPA
jgi:two-component system, OmpR family, response regulator